MDLGTLAAFISYTTQLFDPIQSLARILAEMQAAQASAERVIDLLDTQSDVQDSPEIIERYGDLFHGKKENWPDIKGKVEFKNVTFRYKSGEEVLHKTGGAIAARTPDWTGATAGCAAGNRCRQCTPRPRWARRTGRPG